jgi:hypothetical protein
MSKDNNKGFNDNVNLNPVFEALKNPKFYKEQIDELKKDDFIESIKSLLINPLEELKPPKSAWSQICKEEHRILGTLGNFSLIIGKAKSRKSFFINIAVSTVLKKDKLLNQFVGCLPYNKRKVLYFDTEQGKYHVQLALKRICKQINVDVPDDLDMYYLRSKTPAERLKIIEHIIHNTENLGFVVIDGIKDLITSINDEAEATMIASKLLKWTEEQNIHIITVLHQNKSDNNARGHIGTELINKAETILSVTRSENNKDISVVEPQMCRNKEPEPFAFEIIDNLPVLVEDYEIKTESKKNKFDILELEDFKKYQILTEVFSQGNSFNYSELVFQIKIAFQNQYSNKLGDNRTKVLITYCKNKNWLIQDKPKAPYSLSEFTNTLDSNSNDNLDF